jgi:hypothetical protein
MRVVEELFPGDHKQDFKTLYIKYRVGRIKHQYWLWNRKRATNKLLDHYDASILKNCQPGRTAFFSSAGYYLKDIWPEIDVIEAYPVVKQFYPDITVCVDRQKITDVVNARYDNFASVNSRVGIVSLDTLTEHIECYTRVFNPGARFFFSYRDTQVQYNRLRSDQHLFFLNWAKSLSKFGLTLVWHDINFAKKSLNHLGEYDLLENPDTTNGNLKFWFVYQGEPWKII